MANASGTNLVLQSGSNSNFRLQEEGVAGGGVNDLVNVTNGLTLGGTLNITASGGIGIGQYTLFTYGGSVSGTLAVKPLTGFTTSISTVGGQASTLLVSAGNAQFWDGAVTGNGNSVVGGPGTWDNSTTNWTTATGTTNSAWQGGTAIFGAAGGVVTLGSAISAQGLIFNSNGYSIGGSNALTLAGTAPQINVTLNDTATIATSIISKGGLTANGGGTLILTNGSSGYSGGTNVANGTLQVGTAAAVGSIGTGAISLRNGGTLAVVNISGNTLSGNVTNGVAGVGTLNINSANSTTVSGTLTDGTSGQLAFIQSGSGTTFLTNTGNTYSGATLINGGILQVGTATAAGSIGARSAITLDKGASLNLVNVSGNTFANNIANGSTAASTVNINSTGKLTLSGVLSDGSNSSSGTAVAVPLALTQNGTGTTTITGNNTYTGGTTVNAGTLQIGNGKSGNLGAGSTVSVGSGSSTATLLIDVASQGTFASAITLNNAGSSVQAIETVSETLSGVISGSGSFVQSGTGTTFLSGTNTYTGATQVNAGILVIGNGTAGSLTGSSGITVANNAILGLELPSGQPFTTNVALSGANAQLIVVNSGASASTISSVISGNGIFDQSGSAQTILNSVNTFTGTTNINDGILELDGSLAQGNTVNVQSGGTLTGTGKIFGNATLAAGGTVNFTAGATIFGTLNLTGGTWLGVGTVNGPVTLSSGSFILNNDLTAASGLTIKGGSIVGGGTITGGLTYLSSANMSFDGAMVDGSTPSTLTMNNASSTLTLRGLSTYSGATNILAGTLQVGTGFTGGIPNTSAVNISKGGTLSLNLPINATLSSAISDNGQILAGSTVGSNNYTIASLISGTGSLTKSGANTVTLTGANTYSGGTTVSAGILAVGNGNAAGDALGAGNVTIASGATVFLRPANGQIFSNNIADNATLPSNGLQSDGPNNFTLSGILSGAGVFAQSGTGTVTLSGANTFTGAFNLTAGAISLGSANALGSKGIVSFGGGTLQYTSANVTDYSSRFSTAANQVYRIDTNGQNVTFATALKSAGGTLTKFGAGTLTLTAANTFGGATTINGGTLALAFGKTLSSNILSPSSTVTLGGGTLSLTGTGTQAFTTNLTTAANTTSAIVLGANETLTFAGLTATTGSSLNFNLAAGGANANPVTPVLGTSKVVIACLTMGASINPNFTVTDVGGFGLATVDGSGDVIRLVNNNLLPATGATAGTDYLINNNNTGGAGSSSLVVTPVSESANSITVDTTAAIGSLTLDSNVILSVTNTWNFGGKGTNTYAINPTAVGNGAGLKSTANGATINFNNNNAGAVTIAAPILDNGTTRVSFNGTGTTILTGANTYTGATTIGPGATLEIGAGSAAGSIASNSVFDNGALIFARSDSPPAFAGIISGAGTVTQSGPGTLTLIGANTYTGGTTVAQGTVQLGDGTAVGAKLGSGTVVINSGATLAFNLTSGVTFTNKVTDNGHVTAIGANNYAIASVISGTGDFTMSGSGTVILIGANTYTGPALPAGTAATTVASGTLQLGDGVVAGASLGSGLVSINSNATLALKLASGGAFANKVTDTGLLEVIGSTNFTISSAVSGVGDFTMAGTGTVILSGINSFTGKTNLNSGVLSLGSAGALPTTANSIVFNGGTLQFTAANTIDYSSQFSSIAMSQAYRIDTNGQNVTFAKMALSGAGGLIKLGAGKLTLSAANTFAGATSINAGTLDLANTNALLDSVVSLNGGTLTFDSAVATNAFTIGGLTGAGNLALVNNATSPKPITLTIADSSNITYSGVLSGAGSLAVAGTQTFTLSGAQYLYLSETDLKSGGRWPSPTTTYPGQCIRSVDIRWGNIAGARQSHHLEPSGDAQFLRRRNLRYQRICVHVDLQRGNLGRRSVDHERQRYSRRDRNQYLHRRRLRSLRAAPSRWEMVLR